MLSVPSGAVPDHRAGAAVEQDRHGVRRVDDGDIEFAIAIEVSHHRPRGTRAGGEVGLGRESSRAASEKDPDAVGCGRSNLSTPREF